MRCLPWATLCFLLCPLLVCFGFLFFAFWFEQCFWFLRCLVLDDIGFPFVNPISCLLCFVCIWVLNYNLTLTERTDHNGPSRLKLVIQDPWLAFMEGKVCFEEMFRSIQTWRRIWLIGPRWGRSRRLRIIHFFCWSYETEGAGGRSVSQWLSCFWLPPTNWLLPSVG